MKDSDEIDCPGCGASVPQVFLNSHLDSGCSSRAAVQAKLPLERSSSSVSIVEKNNASKKRASASALDSKGSNKRQRTSAQAVEDSKPLAERVRPSKLEDFVGQEHVLGKGALLRTLIEQDKAQSFVLWGPPASGKTTLARIIAKTTKSVFREVSATNTSTAELRKVFDDAHNLLRLTGQKTILFVDECQRFSKAIQDLFLPVVESGQISCIMATTENPSFRLQSALLSRCCVFVLNKHAQGDILTMLKRGLEHLQSRSDPSASEPPPNLIDDDLLSFLSTAADGDARVALSSLEMAYNTVQADAHTTKDELYKSLKRAHLMYDRTGDQHYNAISALHKSVRGGDADAALYWLARMLQSGDDPLYVARRLVRMASEDIGSADPTALPLALSAYQSAQLIGMPECDCILAQAVVHLAEAKKSTRVYRAYNQAKTLVEKSPAYPIPIHLRNAPTALMRSLNYGKEYIYNPDYMHPIKQTYFPEELNGTKFLSEAHLGDKVDLELLSTWEAECNQGRAWEGRQALEIGKNLDGS